MHTHPVVARERWLADRVRLLEREKAFNRARDELSAARRALPWTPVERHYVFDGPAGRQTLGDLFAGRSQLIVYHFMFAPGWSQGCRSCSFLADHFDGVDCHLRHHDVSLVAVSRAPWRELEAFRQRMGWQFTWVSSHDCDFNSDYQVSFTARDLAQGATSYNYRPRATQDEGEAPGASVFCRDEKGDIFHTYSTYARGLDLLIGTYNFLDLTPKGRNEVGIMDWVRYHDRYAGHD